MTSSPCGESGAEVDDNNDDNDADIDMHMAADIGMRMAADIGMRTAADSNMDTAAAVNMRMAADIDMRTAADIDMPRGGLSGYRHGEPLAVREAYDVPRGSHPQPRIPPQQ